MSIDLDSAAPDTLDVPEPTRRRFPLFFTLLLGLLCLVVAGSGLLYYLGQQQTLQEATQEQLTAIADLKAQEIARWLRERRGDAATFFYSRPGTALRPYLEAPGNARRREETVEWLASLARSYDYRQLALLDTRGRTLLTFPAADLDLQPVTLELVRQALQSRQVESSGLYQSPAPRLDFAVPLLTEQGRAEPPVAILLLRVDAGYFLQPLLSRWPSNSDSAETLLLRWQDEQMVSLYTPRLNGERAELISQQGDGGSVLGQMLVQAREAMADQADNASPLRLFMAGTDYRDRPVLAALEPIEGSNWFLATKLDQGEMAAVQGRIALRTATVAALLMLVAGLLVWGIWHRQSEAALRSVNLSLEREIAGRRFYERKLTIQATHDSLTGLPNRTLLADRLEHAIARAERNEHVFAVLFLDLDRFKTVNDGLGHPVGDHLLKAVSSRLQASVREEDTVARLGGDEFVIVLEYLPRAELAGSVAQHVLLSLNQAVQVEGYEFFVTASIGIALFPKDGTTAEQLLRNADTAMYHAKERGRDNAQFYAEDMNARSLERLVMENNLRYALERDELEIHYQPQADLRSGGLIGLEALLRWHHPQLGLVSPAEFIPLAEETGLIVPIGEWVIRSVCQQIKDWQALGLTGLSVAVNLSPRQFMQANLPELIATILQETGTDPASLELEITEGLLMHDVESAIETLRALKGMRLQLSIDDFGTGYSSLSYLKRFPLDRLKIDRSFVKDITSDPDDAAIALAVIAMAHSLRLKVIAEGVETEGQLDFLREQECDEVQGYYLSRPLPAGEVADWLKQRRHGTAPVA